MLTSLVLIDNCFSWLSPKGKFIDKTNDDSKKVLLLILNLKSFAFKIHETKSFGIDELSFSFKEFGFKT